MIYPIVISKNQNRSNDFIAAMPGLDITFVFDRCDPDIPGKNVVYDGSEDEGFLAGLMRDLGMLILKQKHELKSDDVILFFDGDRIPLFDVREFEMSCFDAVLFPCEDDPRLVCAEGTNALPDTIQDFTEFCKQPSSPFWTCGLAITYKAAQSSINHFGGRLFHQCFDGLKYWEDVALGDYLAYSGFKIGMAPAWMCLSGKIIVDVEASKNLNLDKRNLLRRRLWQ
jgi:hypothetical protein